MVSNMQSIVMSMSVCLSVRLQLENHMAKLTRSLSMFPVAVALSSFSLQYQIKSFIDRTYMVQ